MELVPSSSNPSYPVSITTLESKTVWNWDLKQQANDPITTVTLTKTKANNLQQRTAICIERLADNQQSVHITPNNEAILSFALEVYRQEVNKRIQ